jgi:cysteine-rich repeat protein
VPDLAAVDGAVGVFDQSDDLRGEDVDAAPDAVSYDSPGPEVRGAVCGNGVVEEGEACDDGNDLDDDACNNRCTSPCAATA